MKKAIIFFQLLIYGSSSETKINGPYSEIKISTNGAKNYDREKSGILKLDESKFFIEGNVENISLSQNKSNKYFLVTKRPVTKNIEILFNHFNDNNSSIAYIEKIDFGVSRSIPFLTIVSPYYLDLEETNFTELKFPKKKITKIRIPSATDAKITSIGSYVDTRNNYGTLIATEPVPYNGSIIGFYGKLDKLETIGLKIDKIDEWYIKEFQLTSVGNVGNYTTFLRCGFDECDFYYAEVLVSILYVGHLFTYKDIPNFCPKKIFQGFMSPFVHFLSSCDNENYFVFKVLFGYRKEDVLEEELPEILKNNKNFEMCISDSEIGAVLYYIKKGNVIFYLDEEGKFTEFKINEFLKHSNFQILELNCKGDKLLVVVNDKNLEKNIFLGFRYPLNIDDTLSQLQEFESGGREEECRVSEVNLRVNGYILNNYNSYLTYCKSDFNISANMFILSDTPFIVKNNDVSLENRIRNLNKLNIFSLEIKAENENNNATCKLDFYNIPFLPKENPFSLVKDFKKFTLKNKDFYIDDIFNFTNYPVDFSQRMINLEEAKTQNPNEYSKMKNQMSVLDRAIVSTYLVRHNYAHIKMKWARSQRKVSLDFFYKNKKLDFFYSYDILGNNQLYTPIINIHFIEENRVFCYVVNFRINEKIRRSNSVCFTIDTLKIIFQFNLDVDNVDKNALEYTGIFKFKGENKILLHIAQFCFIIEGSKITKTFYKWPDLSVLKDDNNYYSVNMFGDYIGIENFNKEIESFSQPKIMKINEPLTNLQYRFFCREFTDIRKYEKIGRCTIGPVYGGIFLTFSINNTYKTEDMIEVERIIFVPKIKTEDKKPNQLSEFWINMDIYNDYLFFRRKVLESNTLTATYYYDLKEERTFPNQVIKYDNKRHHFILIKQSGFYENGIKDGDNEEFLIADFFRATILDFRPIEFIPDRKASMRVFQAIKMNRDFKNIMLRFGYISGENVELEDLGYYEVNLSEVIEESKWLNTLNIGIYVLGFLMVFGFPIGLYKYLKWREEYYKKYYRSYDENYIGKKKVK